MMREFDRRRPQAIHRSMVPPIAVALLALLALAVVPTRANDSHQVGIRNLRYTPATLTIRTGDTVVWNNSDEHDHTVTATDGSFRSGNIGNGRSFSHTFNRAGRYPYGCDYHPRMRGLIVVE